MSKESFLWKKIFETFPFFWNFSDEDRKKIGFLSNNFRRCAENFNLRVCRNILTEATLFCTLNKLFVIFGTLSGFLFGSLSKNFLRVYDKCTICVCRNISEKPFPSGNFKFFRHQRLSEKFFGFLSTNIWRCCDNCIPCVYTNFFRKTFCFWKKKNIFSFMSDL